MLRVLIADHVGQSALDIEMHVFQVERPLKAAIADFLADVRETGLDGLKVCCGEDADRMQHARVRKGALDVEFGEALVETHGRREAFDQLIDRLAEASRPGPGGAVAGAGSRFAFCRHEPA